MGDHLKLACGAICGDGSRSRCEGWMELPTRVTVPSYVAGRSMMLSRAAVTYHVPRAGHACQWSPGHATTAVTSHEARESRSGAGTSWEGTVEGVPTVLLPHGSRSS